MRMGWHAAGVGLASILALAPVGAARADDAPMGFLGTLERSLQDASAKVERSVVTVGADRPPESPRRGVPAYMTRPGAPASGILLEGGYVLTSWHHLDGARGVWVKLADGTRLAAEQLGRDAEVDLALLCVKGLAAGAAPALAWRTDAPPVGSFVVTVGRAADRLTVNRGIVSALGRFQGAVLQTDARINHGNLGGALVDLDGQIVGMAIRLSGRPGVNSGVGFVVPSARILASLDAMKEGKVVPQAKKPFLGVRFGKDYMDPPGLELADVVAGTAAAQAGLRKGDILERFDGRVLKDWDSLSTLIAGKRPGDKVLVEGRRGADERFSLELTLGERPEESE